MGTRYVMVIAIAVIAASISTAVALASGGTSSALRDEVRKAQLNSSLPNVKCVDAAGLPLNGDSLHLTEDSQVRLGSMMADVFLRYFNSSITYIDEEVGDED
ncbi:carbohydrate esterase [Perilla frutescens var. frutescens]|nr:carbohydrate esterase [Perilla frutescens var. frutescens]